MIIIFLLISFCDAGCSPACTGDSVCIGSSCKLANDASWNYCWDSLDCADYYNGGCDYYSHRCECGYGSIWSWYYLECLSLNDGGFGYGGAPKGGWCWYDSDCSDQSSYGKCHNNHCRCPDYVTASSVNGKCGFASDGTHACSDNDNCQDNVYGGCINSVCACKAGYQWYSSHGICRAYNSGDHSCNAIAECWDKSSRGRCDGVCTCISNYHYSSTYHLCLAYNDNTVTCSFKDTCYDQSNRASCAGKCTCDGNSVYSSGNKRCLGLNNGASSCDSLTDCYDQTSATASCSLNKCTCKSSCSYDVGSKMCLAPNDNTVACTSLSNCIDRNSNTAKCDTNCMCKPNSEWNSTHSKCLIPNDNINLCQNLNECLDHTTVGKCNTYCTCSPNNAWVTSDKRCGCNIGRYEASSGAGNCIECPAGKYQDLYGETSCKDCPQGTYLTTTGGHAESDCNPCEIGAYGPSAGLSTPCPLCPAGSISTTQKSFTCSNCSFGTYQNNSGQHSCLDCIPGQYQDEEGKDECKPCPAGTFGPGSKQTSLSACAPCPTGQANALLGQIACFDCEKGMYTDVIGSFTCKNCSVGKFQNAKGQSHCEECSAGTYQNEEGKMECINCTSGMYNPYIGASTCISCSAGTYAPNEGMASCFSCAAGTYQDSVGQSSCLNCSTGTYQSTLGQTSCTKCGYGTYNPYTQKTSINDCLECPLGKYNSLLGQNLCQNCSVGTHANITAKQLCDPCDIGTFANLTGQVNCFECPPRTFQNETGKPNCFNCLSNTYNPFYKQTACIACPDHSHSEEGSAICTCEVGFFYDSSISIQYCSQCHEFCSSCFGEKVNCTGCVVNSGIDYVVYDPSNSTCLCREEDGYYVFTNASGLQECRKCHPMCKRCYGDSLFECYECRTGIPGMANFTANTCDCISGSYYDSSKSNPAYYCQKCADFCLTCTTSMYNCSSCENNDGVIMLSNSTCSCSRPGYFIYFNSSTLKNECVECHPLCINCDGPYQTQCDVCDSSLGAVYVSPRTCECKYHFYFDYSTEKCESCDNLCGNCFGPTASQCYDCDFSVAYSVEDDLFLCAAECTSIGPYFSSGTVCKCCHSDCAQCWAAESNNCYLCADEDKVMLKGSCYDECPSHYYAQSRVCYSCHSTCLDCLNGTKKSCTSCDSTRLFYQNQCLEQCPDGTYAKFGICVDCSSPCETCTSRADCITCAQNYYKIEGTTSCVRGEDCPAGTFPDDKTRTCATCFYTCLTCAGPTSSDCIICNYGLGYSKNSDEVGECYMLVCVDGMYINIDNELKKAWCKYCHDSCATCDKEGGENCITCKPNFQPFLSPVANHQICKSCEDMNSGYRMKSDGSCEEICGDGINLGDLECDDGNKLDGDGCSSGCTVEYGFRCTHKYGEIDVCVDVLSPSASLYVSASNQLTVIFSEFIFSELDSASLTNSMIVVLDGTSDSCNVSWSLSDTFSMFSKLKKLNISTSIPCTIKGKNEKFLVIFLKPNKLTDRAGNSLSTPRVSAYAKRFMYISEAEKAVVDSSGSSFSSSSLITFGLAIGMIAFQSVAINSFWAFVNLLQMISYLPMIQINIPINLELFLTEYLTMKKITFPFNLLPDCIPNPLSWVSDFITKPLNENFQICGYDSLSFLYNFADELLTWVFLFVVYIFLRILTAYIPRKRFETIHKWREDYEYNGIFRVLIECFLNLNFCAFLNIWMLDISSFVNVISLFGASLAAYMSTSFMVKCMKLVEASQEELESEEFKKQFGTLTEDLKTDILLGRQFYPIFLIRRLIYSLILVVFVNFPQLQLGLIIGIIIMPMIFYLIIVRPFSNESQNYLNLYNEVVLLLAFIWVWVQNSTTFFDNNILTMGWLLIALILLSLGITWILLIPGSIKEIIEWCRKPKTEANESQSLSPEQARDSSSSKEKSEVSPSLQLKKNDLFEISSQERNENIESNVIINNITLIPNPVPRIHKRRTKKSHKTHKIVY